ncbi:DJ-1/PfpI family protein [Dysgonomonas macrotermitis]|uniref:4-methyl-5(B-hydroxyethyl)-thiazole monophosphate biosynthesis n=1 Tax=Dysgonomonas macrotermitis TaxID=1346286 RepID=A0A1M4UQF9_9BACT|nr:DJ-1/PfpI family protein [Dysgonomonas macrotermitis]SHE58830.1 4-methyl-5(b-hydroxyethyl)-thiazole monophosphate biosynthesis [Dysgonomonas macrotermitis]
MAKKVLLFLSEGFEAYEASVFTDVFGWSREVSINPVDLVTTGFQSTIKCYWNLIITPELPFDQVDINDFDALAIPGGAEEAGFFQDAYDERFLDLIREFDKQGKPIAAICVAAMPIAKSGILKDRKATTWDLNNGVRRKQLSDFGANVQDKDLVIDRNIITSTGPATSLSVAFKLLEMLTDIEHVNEIKRNMRFKLD